MYTATAAAYIRVSTDEQTEYSPTVQLEDILAFAQNRNIFVPEEFIFADEGISGKRADSRPAFMAMIRAARKKSNGISLILVHKYDRFSRKKDDQVLYKAMLKKDGIRVISVKEPIPDDDKFAVIYESMLEAMAEYYSLNLAEEVKKTMVKKAQKGEYQTAAPFGYKNENKTLSVVPEEAEIIKYIFDSYINRHTPLNSIASSINDMGITTHRGGLFEGRTINYILNNPVYCGYARWTPDGRIRRNFSNPSTLTVKGSFEPIISEDIFKAAQAIVKRSAYPDTPGSRPVSSVKHYLSGIIKCSSCGKSLVIVRNFKKGGFFMQCGGYNHGTCHISHSISSSVLIPAVITALRAIPKAEGKFNASDIHYSPSMSAKQAALLTEKALKRLNRARDAFLAGIDSIEDYKRIKEKTEKEIAEIQKNSSVSADEERYAARLIDKSRCIAEFLEDEEINPDDKKYVVRYVIDHMVFNRPEGCLDIYIKA